MSDFARSTADRAAERERETPGVRMRAARLVAAIDVQTRGQREIEVLLALGAACPFTRLWEIEIWLEEVCARFYSESEVPICL
jgi:hypothetical protein